MVLGGGPHRLEVRMIEWHAIRRVHHQPPRPARSSPAADFLEAARHVARAGEDHAADAIGIGAAVILHPAVIGAVHPRLERHVVARGPRSEPSGGQREIDVHALVVHVIDALRGVVIHARVRLARAVRAREPGHVLAPGVLGVGGAQPAAVVTLAPGVDGVAAVGRRLVLIPRRQLRLLRIGQVLFQDVQVRPYMGIGVENLEAILRHLVLRPDIRRTVTRTDGRLASRRKCFPGCASARRRGPGSPPGPASPKTKRNPGTSPPGVPN
jgi:hypothetical protein